MTTSPSYDAALPRDYVGAVHTCRSQYHVTLALCVLSLCVSVCLSVSVSVCLHVCVHVYVYTDMVYGDASCHNIYTEYVECADPTGCGTGPDSRAWDYQVSSNTQFTCLNLELCVIQIKLCTLVVHLFILPRQTPSSMTRILHYASQRAGHASLPGPTAPLVTQLLQLPVPDYGTVYRHISEMLTYHTVGSGGH